MDGQGDRYYQMQVLQEEVQMLRGMVEELNYELQQLKQRQMDDYLACKNIFVSPVGFQMTFWDFGHVKTSLLAQ